VLRAAMTPLHTGHLFRTASLRLALIDQHARILSSPGPIANYGRYIEDIIGRL
jgi:hypothetical protein